MFNAIKGKGAMHFHLRATKHLAAMSICIINVLDNFKKVKWKWAQEICFRGEGDSRVKELVTELPVGFDQCTIPVHVLTFLTTLASVVS